MLLETTAIHRMSSAPSSNTSLLPPERTVRVSEMCSVTTIQDYESALFPAMNNSAAQYAIYGLNDYAITDDLHFAHLYYIFLKLYVSKPSAALSSEILMLENMLSGQYVVGIHIRLGGPEVLDMGYRHSTSVIPEMVDVGKQLCDLHSHSPLATAGGVNCTFLVVSDNLGAVRKVEEELNGLSIASLTPSGNVVHIDHRYPILWQSGPGIILDEMKMFVDWYLLGKRSNALVLSR